jgi:hypothetical protein
MNDRDRLNQLRALRDHLNRLPQSAERDRMLREIGSRAVDLESSEPVRRLTLKPKAAADPPPTPSDAPARARRAPRTTRRPGAQGEAARVRSRAAAADAFAASVRPTPALPEGLMLSLDDDAPTPSDRPWTRGLRG